MSRYRFPLQQVLELREASEKESARGLAEARRLKDDAERTRAELAGARDEERARLASAQGPVGHLQNLTYVLDRMDEKVQHADAVCDEADAEVARTMEAFREAVRKRSALGQLKERRMGEWRHAELDKERKTMDEIALTRHARSEGHDAPGGN